MGVPHDEETNACLVGQESLGPLTLSLSRPRQFGLVYGVITEHRAQEIDHAQPEIRVDEPVHRGGNGMLDNAMDQPGLPAGLPQPISVNSRDPAAPDLEGRPTRAEGQAQISLPEITIPPVVVASYHYNRESSSQHRECGCDVKAASGNHPGIGEPEIEEIAVDEQAVAQRRHGIEEVEQCPLDSRRRHSEVGIGHDYKGAAEHGAKDGLLPRRVQPEPSGSAFDAPRNV